MNTDEEAGVTQYDQYTKTLFLFSLFVVYLRIQLLVEAM
jgi:hypothetical protein